MISIISESFLSGMFGVIGGITPLVIILVFLFFKTRSNLRNWIPSEQKRIGEMKEMLVKDKERLSQFLQVRNKLKDNQVAPETLNLVELKTEQAIFDKEYEILKSEYWIKKVQTSGFFDWVASYFRNSYIKDFFKK